MKQGRLAIWVGALALVATAIACGGGGDSPTQPSTPTPPSGGGGGTQAPAAVTITVSSTGITTSGATVAAGGTITWVNTDNRAHDMSSDPHPQHTDCPSLNAGDLNPGQQRTVTASNVRTCGFHDHLNPGTQSLTGQIRVQ